MRRPDRDLLGGHGGLLSLAPGTGAGDWDHARAVVLALRLTDCGFGASEVGVVAVLTVDHRHVEGDVERTAAGVSLDPGELRLALACARILPWRPAPCGTSLPVAGQVVAGQYRSLPLSMLGSTLRRAGRRRQRQGLRTPGRRSTIEGRQISATTRWTVAVRSRTDANRGRRCGGG